MSHPLLGKTTVAIGVMLGLLAVPYASPRLAAFRITRAPWDTSAIDVAGVAAASPPASATLTQGETNLKASTNEKTVTNALPDTSADAPAPIDPKILAKTKGSIAIEDPADAMDAFYASLAKTKAKEEGAVTRILHYGDSVITSDYISGTMRRKMQDTYGDAGHGFLLVANPWEWYFHNDVSHGASDGWRSSRITGPLTNDGMYGIGGVTFTGSNGATAYFGTAEGKGTHGKAVSRFDIYYLETTSGGEIEIKVGATTERFSTKGEGEKISKIHSVDVPDGEARMNIRVVSGAPRLFGVALERSGPGVVYDALGANGGRSEHWASMDGKHWADQMALRKPALVILQYGTNESEAGVLDADRYEKSLRSVVEKVKAAAPDASILIASPLDRAENAGGEGRYRTKPVIKKLVASQRNVAASEKVAFFDTFEAMGGDGSMGKWVQKGLCGGDLTHPTPQGAEIIGDLFFKSVSTGFDAYLSRHPAH